VPFVIHKRGVENQIHAPANGSAASHPDATLSFGKVP